MFMQLVGGGTLLALASIAVTLGRYGQNVDNIAEDVAVIRTDTIKNGDRLHQLSQEIAIQNRVNEEVDKRLEKLEVK